MLNCHKILTYVFFIIILLSSFVKPSYADEPFEIYIRVYRNDSYVIPAQNKIVISSAEMRPFWVFIKNVTNKSQKLAIEGSQGANSYFSFEITDEYNDKNIISKKIDPELSVTAGYTYIPAGQAREFKIVLDSNEWNNIFALVNKGATKARARVVYKDGSKNIYSPYYELIFQ